MQTATNVPEGSDSQAESGVDWVTATWPAGAEATAALPLAKDLVSQEEERGERVRVFRALGYLGLSAGGAAWGSRRDGLILRLSGEAARVWWRRPLVQGGKVTRLDLQTTTTLSTSEPSWHLAAWTQFRAGESGRKVQRSGSCTTWMPSGGIVALGCRKGERYLRLYDKSVQARVGAPGTVWRAEVETKGELARWRSTALLSSPSPEALCARYVYSDFLRSHVTPRWPSPGRSLREGMTEAHRPRRAAPDRDPWQWLNAVAKPLILRMLMGNDGEAMRAWLRALADLPPDRLPPRRGVPRS